MFCLYVFIWTRSVLQYIFFFVFHAQYIFVHIIWYRWHNNRNDITYSLSLSLFFYDLPYPIFRPSFIHSLLDFFRLSPHSSFIMRYLCMHICTLRVYRTAGWKEKCVNKILLLPSTPSSSLCGYSTFEWQYLVICILFLLYIHMNIYAVWCCRVLYISNDSKRTKNEEQQRACRRRPEPEYIRVYDAPMLYVGSLRPMIYGVCM